MKARYFAAAASVLVMAACGGGDAETDLGADTAAFPAPAPMDTSMAAPMPMDSAAMGMDSAAMTGMDSATMDTTAAVTP